LFSATTSAPVSKFSTVDLPAFVYNLPLRRQAIDGVCGLHAVLHVFCARLRALARAAHSAPARGGDQLPIVFRLSTRADPPVCRDKVMPHPIVAAKGTAAEPAQLQSTSRLRAPLREDIEKQLRSIENFARE